jgi:AcrR family transcriptional regulator
VIESVEQPAAAPAVQRRGVARRKAILEAAEALLTEEGYDAATLKAIGDRAGIPIASMYHYFSDRHQVEIELLKRYLRELEEHIGQTLEMPAALTLRDAVDAVINSLLIYLAHHPSCVELWFAGRRHPDIAELVEAFDQTTAEQFWRLLIHGGLIRPETPFHVVRLTFEAANRLFDVAFKISRTGDGTTMREAARMATAYLATYAPDVD